MGTQLHSNKWLNKTSCLKFVTLMLTFYCHFLLLSVGANPASQTQSFAKPAGKILEKLKWPVCLNRQIRQRFKSTPQNTRNM